MYPPPLNIRSEIVNDRCLMFLMNQSIEKTSHKEYPFTVLETFKEFVYLFKN